MGSHPGRARAVVTLAVDLRRGRRAVMSVRPADGGGRAVARGERRQVRAGRRARKGSGQWPCARGPRLDQGGRCSPDGAGRRNADPDADGPRAAADRAGRVEPGLGSGRAYDLPACARCMVVSHVLIRPLDSAARLGPRVQPAIPASGVNPSASSAKQATARCWLCSFARYLSVTRRDINNLSRRRTGVHPSDLYFREVLHCGHS
jgi:hypothetical protein